MRFKNEESGLRMRLKEEKKGGQQEEKRIVKRGRKEERKKRIEQAELRIGKVSKRCERR